MFTGSGYGKAAGRLVALYGHQPDLACSLGPAPGAPGPAERLEHDDGRVAIGGGAA